MNKSKQLGWILNIAAILILSSQVIDFSLLTVLAYSRNITFTEYGMGFSFNTHLLEFEEDEPSSERPVVNGYFHILGDQTNGTDGERLMPQWDPDANIMRVCL